MRRKRPIWPTNSINWAVKQCSLISVCTAILQLVIRFNLGIDSPDPPSLRRTAIDLTHSLSRRYLNAKQQCSVRSKWRLMAPRSRSGSFSQHGRRSSASGLTTLYAIQRLTCLQRDARRNQASTRFRFHRSTWEVADHIRSRSTPRNVVTDSRRCISLAAIALLYDFSY